MVAIHNKNGQGLLPESGYLNVLGQVSSQSTIKMDKGYYVQVKKSIFNEKVVAIHNKNGQGLLLTTAAIGAGANMCRNPQ